MKDVLLVLLAVVVCGLVQITSGHRAEPAPAAFRPVSAVAM